MSEKKYRLPREFAEKWVAALRSGEYKQSTKNLYNDAGYCCLGVACKIEGISDDAMFGVVYPNIKWVPEHLQYNNLQIECANLNDQQHKSFPEIADWIEQNCEFV